MKNHFLYCSNTSIPWTESNILYKGDKPNQTIYVNDVCRYVSYIPPSTGSSTHLRICEFEVSGKYCVVQIMTNLDIGVSRPE